MKKWIDYMSGFLKDGIMPARSAMAIGACRRKSPKLIHSKDPARANRQGTARHGLFLPRSALDGPLRHAARASRTTRSEFDALAEEREDGIQRASSSTPQTGQYDNGSQTSSVLPLAFGLVPDEQRAQVFEHPRRQDH